MDWKNLINRTKDFGSKAIEKTKSVAQNGIKEIQNYRHAKINPEREALRKKMLEINAIELGRKPLVTDSDWARLDNALSKSELDDLEKEINERFVSVARYGGHRHKWQH